MAVVVNRFREYILLFNVIDPSLNYMHFISGGLVRPSPPGRGAQRLFRRGSRGLETREDEITFLNSTSDYNLTFAIQKRDLDKFETWTDFEEKRRGAVVASATPRSRAPVRWMRAYLT